jgi:hypothetical protein
LDKRHQVFVSSTYADLKDERQAVLRTLMELDCIPAGMELFPAADEDQLEFIKRVIDDCDYYLLIIGGRYGSTTADGISYTEQEYDYAISKGLKVIALLHEDPGTISAAKSELDPVLRERLASFRTRVSNGRLVKFWKTSDQLPGLVALNVQKAIKLYPSVGWVRASAVSNVEALSELNELRKANARLSEQVKSLSVGLVPSLEDIAGLDESIEISGTDRYNHVNRDWSVNVSWRQIFAWISPYLIRIPNETLVKSTLKDALYKQTRRLGSLAELDDQDFQTVSVQLRALGLVSVQYADTTAGGRAVFWSATPTGRRLTIELRAIRSKSLKKS